MFAKGSRYRKVPESSPLDARGERQRGKELRVTPRTAGRFTHTVREGERLDLLAFKYYGDPTRWWQIGDANPEEPYPPNLLDRRPLVAERFVLEYATFAARYEQLFTALDAIAQATPLENLSEAPPTAPRFLETTAIVIYAASSATRDQIIGEIKTHGFNLLDIYGQSVAGTTTEAFTFDDRAAKSDWRALVEQLERAAGVLSARSRAFESALEVIYNAESVERSEIIGMIHGHGFELSSASSVSTRTGANIVIPPNQIA
ncbi:MAG TPA: hypothetical protein VFS10_19820 [Pyrinomonadaceae bacterium]|nr:hypothetical protein [Pyrinomonadaceae bacterium]